MKEKNKMALRSLISCLGMRVKFTTCYGGVIKGKLSYDQEMERWYLDCGTFREGNTLFKYHPGFCEKKDTRKYKVNDKAEVVGVKRRVA